MAKIGIFRDMIWESGGIETWLYNIAKRWGNTHDITIYYDNSDPKQLKRLQRLVKCIQYEGQDIEVDTAIWCYDFLAFNTTKAKRKIHVVHADYQHVYNFNKGLDFVPKVDELYAVSKRAARSAEKLFQKPVGVLYNPLAFEVEKKTLDIVSATRLSYEKGFHRMVKLDKALQKAGVDYKWEIYTHSNEEERIANSFSENVVFKKPIMSIIDRMAKADFMVQLSNTESFGYSIVEAMAVGTNLVVTDIPVLPELNVNKHNAIIVPLRKHFVNYDKIVEQIIAKSPYVPPHADYEQILGEPTKVDYKPIFVKNIAGFDIMLPDGRWLEPKHTTVIDDYDGKTKGLKVVK